MSVIMWLRSAQGYEVCERCGGLMPQLVRRYVCTDCCHPNAGTTIVRRQVVPPVHQAIAFLGALAVIIMTCLELAWHG